VILEMIQSKECFFVHMKEMLDFLLKYSIDQDKEFYPWRDCDILSGVLERNYIPILLESHPWIGDIINSDKLGITSLSDFGILSLKFNGLSTQNLRNLDTIFKTFLKKDSYAHAFLFGVTNHWLTIIINKVNGVVETILFDSRNIYVVERNDEEIVSKLDERIKKHGKVVPPYMYELYVQSVKDTKFLTHLFHKCATGQVNIISEVIDLNMTGFFESYDGIMIPFNSKEEFKLKLNMWFDTYFPPPVLESNVIRLISRFTTKILKPDKIKRFQNWIKEIETNTDKEECTEENFQRFFFNIEKFKTIFPDTSIESNHCLPTENNYSLKTKVQKLYNNNV